MTLHVIGTGSKGNGYLLEALTGEKLMLEAGVPFKKVLLALGGNTEKVAGCLLTHEHGDHAKHVKDVVGHGIKVYTMQGTRNQLLKTVPGNMIQELPRGEQYQLGGFIINTFPTAHDAADPCGFLIWHQEMGTLLFVTDSTQVPFLFDGVNNIMVEANYDRRLLEAREDIPDSLKGRIAGNHMGIDDTLRFLGRQDLSQVNNIVLIHLSEHDGDPQGFYAKVTGATGKTVTIAEKGLKMTFNKTPF